MVNIDNLPVFDFKYGQFEVTPRILDMARYFKGQFSSPGLLVDRVIKPYLAYAKSFVWGEIDYKPVFHELLINFMATEKFSYEEAFKLENEQFRAMVFGSINIREMLEHLTYERVKTEGMPVRHLFWDKYGENEYYKEYDIYYSTLKVATDKLGVDGFAYCIECNCTTTDKQHYLWINEQYKDSPLEGIASLCMYWEDHISNIQYLYRQGDDFVMSLKQPIKPSGKIRSLTKEEYFGLLVAQS